MRKMKDSGVEWIGEIPEDWSVTKTSRFYCVQLGKMLQGNKRSDDDSFEYYLCAANVGGNKLKLEELKRMWFSSNEKQMYQVKKGDLLVVEGGDVGSCDIMEAYSEPVYIQNALHRVRGESEVDNRLLRYQLINAKNNGYIDLVCNKATIAHFTKDKLENTPIVVIPQKEKNSVVDCLDKNCSAIDSIIDKTRASIEEYKKLRQAVITQAVTKGVRGDRPMKDSGIEWIGHIPKDWDVLKIKHLLRLRDEKNYRPLNEVNLISLYTDLGVVQHSDLEKTTGNKASNADGYKIVKKDDIVVNIILCWMGAIGRSDYDGVTSPAYDVYIPNKEIIDPEFYHFLFRTDGFAGDCYKRGRGIMAMRWRTYSDQFRDISVVVPPLEEQREIVDWIKTRSNRIDGLIENKNAILSEMENMKRSLIFEYVTGKKEVP